MEQKRDITNTPTLYLSIISSILLLLSTMYSQKLASELWLLFLIILIPVILFFIVTTITSLIFWTENNSIYDIPFLPFMINILLLALIIILPLNKIRNKIEFAMHRRQFEKAVDFILSKETEQTIYPKIFKLPENYENLSVGGGEVIVINKGDKKGVFFYKFRGVPDGQIGVFENCRE